MRPCSICAACCTGHGGRASATGMPILRSAEFAGPLVHPPGRAPGPALASPGCAEELAKVLDEG